MANTSTEIANQSLGLISDRVISSIDDTTDPNAIYCKTYFEQALDQVINRVKPDSCEAEANLAADTNFVSGNYQMAYRYLLPTDPYCLKPISANGVNWDQSGYRIIGRFIASNDTPMFLRYVSRPADYSIMPAALTNAVVYSLAIKISIPKQLSNTARQSLIEEYERTVIGQAISDENENDGAGDRLTNSSTWYNGYSGGYSESCDSWVYPNN